MIEVRYLSSHNTISGWSSGSCRLGGWANLAAWLKEGDGKRMVYAIEEVGPHVVDGPIKMPINLVSAQGKIGPYHILVDADNETVGELWSATEAEAKQLVDMANAGSRKP